MHPGTVNWQGHSAKKRHLFGGGRVPLGMVEKPPQNGLPAFEIVSFRNLTLVHLGRSD